VTTTRRTALLVAPIVAAFTFAGAVPTVATAAPRHSAGTAVIVEAASTQTASAAVTRVGGRVDSPLAVVAGVAAHVDAAGLRSLTHNPDVRVTPDIVLKATGKGFSAATSASDTQMTAMSPGSTWSLDAGSGVGVALIDTGVNPTPDLRGDRLVRGPDLSGERDGVDRFGHGTFMAGLIAGDGTASSRSGVRHVGVAPGATIVAVKVAGADGSTTLSKLIAGIGWVIVHREDNHIRVLNLSFGADVNLPYLANPLSGAVEAAWASGITVVTSAGNNGPGSVTSPGDDPWVVTVGASDSTGNTATANNPIAAWSGTKTFARYSKPDLVAPGVSDVSLRAPGSTIDLANPNARIGDTYFRGSGTSMSTALVSGAAADVLDEHPQATPDDVKGALIDGGISISGSTAPAVSVSGAEQATPSATWSQRFPIAFGGLGRGLTDQMPWTASRWTASRWTASRWTDGGFSASRWTDSGFSASRWTDSSWTASRWTDSSWNDAAWTASRWTASRWTDSSWNSLAWG
jgi:serine protease AprX